MPAKLLNAIKWPVMGGLLGFLLFFVLLQYGFMVAMDHFPDKAIDVLGITVATFVAAWAGGWAAFGAERETQEMNRLASRVSAANKAIFAINMAYTIYQNLQEHYVDANNARANPRRALEMNSPQAGMLTNRIEFDFDELSFLLEQQGNRGPLALKKLMMLEWKYQILFQTIEYRAETMEEIRMAVHANPVANSSFDAIKSIHPAAFKKLEAVTTQMIESVDSGLIDTKDAYEELRSVLQSQYPGKKFLNASDMEPASQ